ncbi:MAG TPA: alpha/beta fold hydrolase [Rhizomicrobium sp.]|nr:alpha/beta fold hydrolase [Rhizomicrobium sp.]
MAGVFRLAFHRIAPRRRKTGVEDWRWSLAAADPSAGLVSGAFPLSDGALAPYRLWRAETPKALLVLLHGAFDYSGAFDEIGPKLAARGFCALAFDQRGFGATRSRRHWCGIKRMVQDVVDAIAFLRQRFGDRPVFIIGESMGADIAVQTVAANPDIDVSGLVLAAPGAVSDAFRRLLWGALIRLVSYFAPRSEINVERISGGEFTPAGAIRLLGDPLVLRGVRPAMASGLFDLAVSTNAAAAKVKIPALTMVGSKEDLLYTKCIERLHDALAGPKTLKVFEGGPHLLFHWRNAEAVLDRSISWIESHLDSLITHNGAQEICRSGTLL